MEDLKRIDYKEGMTHKDVREAINANTERANANFAEVGGNGDVPYVVSLLKLRDEDGNAHLFVGTDRELKDGDYLKIMRCRTSKKSRSESAVNNTLFKKWGIATTSNYVDKGYFQPLGWIDFQKCYFKLIGGGDGARYRYQFTGPDDEPVLLDRMASNFMQMKNNFGSKRSEVKFSAWTKNEYIYWYEDMRNNDPVGASIPLGVAVLRCEDGSEPGGVYKEISKCHIGGRPYLFRSNIARFDITVDITAWGLDGEGNFVYPLDEGSLINGLGIRIH